jgi:hypothetical protein
LLYCLENNKEKVLAGCQLLMPVILASWEAEIEKIKVQGQEK